MQIYRQSPFTIRILEIALPHPFPPSDHLLAALSIKTSHVTPSYTQKNNFPFAYDTNHSVVPNFSMFMAIITLIYIREHVNMPVLVYVPRR